MTIPRFKRVPVNWNLLKKRINEEGYSLASIARKIGVSKDILYKANEDHRLNPAIVHEISKHMSLDMRAILGSFNYERIHNGRSTSGRLGTDWLYLEREARKKDYSLGKLSCDLGKSPGYLGSCKREGGISEDVMIQIGEILGIDYHNLIKVTSYDKWNLRHEIVDMVSSQEYPDLAKDDINDLYQGASPLWSKLKEVMIGEVSNYIIRDYEIVSESDYDLAEKHKPDLHSFSMHDVAKCANLNDLPPDWKHLAFACMKKYGLPPFSE